MEAEHTCQIVPHDLNSVIRRIVRAMMLDDSTDVILKKKTLELILAVCSTFQHRKQSDLNVFLSDLFSFPTP